MADTDGGAATDGMGAKGSIGNYKGVMLCNRPNENGLARKPERRGPDPFLSRVDKKDPLGWNPVKKIFPQRERDPREFKHNVLNKHKKWLRELQKKKQHDNQTKEVEGKIKEERSKKFKENSAAQRQKLQDLKEEVNVINKVLDEDEPVNKEPERLGKLTSKNLQKHTRNEDEVHSQQSKHEEKEKEKDKVSVTGSAKAKKSKKAKKPMWAYTEEKAAKVENQEEEEDVDQLLDFAYDLDYEKFIHDFEVRQAMELIKERVDEMKKDEDWKQKIAEDWNRAAEEEVVADGGEAPKKKREVKSSGVEKADTESLFSATESAASRISEARARRKAREEAKKGDDAASEAGWDKSSKVARDFKAGDEDRLAREIANEVLQSRQSLRGVHSNQSIRKLLEKEAKKQIQDSMNGHVYEPKINVIKEKEDRGQPDASNLPYLHRNPAI
eukprot:CAMPEP_0115011858 /NCGR_PEP_ID=MMETSP0216-20121206/24334_1 /TAXON_ID=223996 /ORGANISM="Protocruzia adherens, Strain Boccale" /LENGTH=441 /DNA_ID=CAMNT_0002380689 /DNA_START=32 /DNA_END=1357 /DNA_ORIENTATION=+